MTIHCEPGELAHRRRDYLLPCVQHFYSRPVHIVRGQLQYVYDHAGNRYLDCFSGVSVVNCGHCHPEIVAAICDQARTLQHCATIYLSEPMVELAENLAAITPGDLRQSFFCTSGTEANEGAALLASLHTGRSGFLSLGQSLHGRTRRAMELTGLAMWRADPHPAGDVVFVPPPYCYRCPLQKRHPDCRLACAELAEQTIKTAPWRPAAMFAEPIQGNGGIIVPPPGYFERLGEILDHYGILLIMDEVQTGFGRTGKMFATQHYNITPAIMTVAKALSNGLPLSAFIAVPGVAASFTRPSASSLGGNPVAAASALATLKVLAKYHLPAQAAELGEHLKTGLGELKKRHPLIGDVRGKGLMLGAELVLPDKEPAPRQTDLLLEKMKDRGFLVGKNGLHRNVLAFQPPLVITRSDADALLNALDDALTDLN